MTWSDRRRGLTGSREPIVSQTTRKAGSEHSTVGQLSAQTARLNAEQTALNVLSNRLTASVALIQDLGGGWDASQLTAKKK